MSGDDLNQATPREGREDAEWQRARRPEQKAERRRAILDATLALLDEVGLTGTTLSEIARRSGSSKANCYRYFESREAILLELTLTESAAWMEDVASALAPLSGTDDLEAVVRVFVDSIVERPRLCGLFSGIYSVMERNVDARGMAEFEAAFHDAVFGSCDVIANTLPDLTTEDAEHFVLFLGFFVAGAWPNAKPIRRADDQGRPTPPRRDFRETLQTHSRAVLRGLIAEHGASTPAPSAVD